MEIYVDDIVDHLETLSPVSTTSTATTANDVQVKCARSSTSEITSSVASIYIGSSSPSSPEDDTILKQGVGPNGPNTTSLASNTDNIMTLNDVEFKFITNLDSQTTSRMTSSCIESDTRSGADLDRDVNRRVSKVTKLILDDFYFVRRLGGGDIGTVYLVELKGSRGSMFAAKVMDKEELAYRNKESRAGIEREILEMLDHPFLPSLYATLDCPKWSCLLTEFCPGGDLHVLRQHQPERRFNEDVVRFYASEVVVALEYLHMLGVVYRDLKPENVLVRSDGHVMLTDFDLSLKCDNSTLTAQLVFDQSESETHRSIDNHKINSTRFSISSCILPSFVIPRVSCLQPGPRRRKKGRGHRETLKIVAEPTDARSMSFVGTHEYLAPEIVSGEGHGNAVDWWTLGIFIYELFYGVTPFRGMDNEFTLANIVARGLEFPKEPVVAASAKDLIIELLNKDPSKRMGSLMGATAIKHHPFFEGVNWALLRCTKPPYIPRPYNPKDLVSSNNDHFDSKIVDYY
ncbi:hypothetical protein BUALT_Bualt06G0033900 [Buddleja alternifolia]|uniref:non-specific serine/threonine protein kinase n=1 Tax=Buddleja alternifolia TaxID=168488 RepID=A0AAV6XDS3_9LAMI|nr:hypothetical protein BUALT_Bualt06G0033900 [Buddleja alternifolia]